ncbi:dnaJ homolog subfamily C member 2-like [Montipora capricornis]|uniref:dnaJ homolog subfamily C member 2-like n=1 Tax=Montipora capricornis TaxID=246305 RepID=UPI0035F19B3E
MALPPAKEGDKTLVVSRLSAPSSLQIEPVGRWFEANLRRRQQGFFSHHSSSSSNSSAASEGSFSSDEEDEDYLVTLDPSEWKQQDHYKVLGLGKLRYKASFGDIKKAFRKKVLKHHPDKKSSQPNAKDSKLCEQSLFACITIANDILSNKAKRRAYDSVDPHFDDSIPSVNANSKSNFIDVFGPVFERNARWSKHQPAPSLGNYDSNFEEVDNFYSFWYNFESWREFSYLDEEEKEKGENRDERRWIEKQNKAMRQKRKKEEITRIRNLVDNAYACDSRIKRFKDEEKERKLAEKKAKEEAARLAAEEKERQRLEELENERKLKEKEEQEAKKQAQAAKEEKTRIKNLMKKERKTVRTIIKNYDYFVTDEETRIREMEVIDRLLDIISLESLQSFREGLENADSMDGAKLIYEKQMQPMREKMRQEATVETKETTKSKDSDEISDDWTEDQTQLLIKAVNLFPAGTASRWKVISDYVNMHAKTGTLRDSKLVIKKVKNLKKLDPGKKEEVNRNAFARFDKDHSQSKGAQSDPTVRYNGTDSSRSSQVTTEKPWTSEEQRLLERALRSYPASTPERWDRIAESLPGRTKKECMKRYKDLVEMVKAKKAAQNKGQVA